MKTTPLLLLAVLLGNSHPALQAQPAARLGADITIHRDLSYIADGHERQKLDLYLPAKRVTPLPLVIWVHGGGWQGGSRQGYPPALSLLENGYAVASIGYRLSGHAIFPAQIEDCQAAVRWLRKHAADYGIDPTRFGAMGSSAGGHLVALLGTAGNAPGWTDSANPDPSVRIQAVCDFFGPTDFLQMGGFHSRDDSPESLLLGGKLDENPAKAARANPITYVDDADPPFLIVHGAKDRVVPPAQSELLQAALEKAGVPVRLHLLPEAGHGGPAFRDPEVVKMVTDFFDQHLKKDTN